MMKNSIISELTKQAQETPIQDYAPEVEYLN